MKSFVAIIFMSLSLSSWTQSLKSAEILEAKRLTDERRRELEVREEQRIRKEWDREEAQAQEFEEEKRRTDLIRAQGREPAE